MGLLKTPSATTPSRSHLRDFFREKIIGRQSEPNTAVRRRFNAAATPEEREAVSATAKSIEKARAAYREKADALSPEARQSLNVYEKLSRTVIGKLPQEHQEQAWLNFYTHTADRMHGRKFDAPPLNHNPAAEVPRHALQDKPQPDRSGDIER